MITTLVNQVLRAVSRVLRLEQKNNENAAAANESYFSLSPIAHADPTKHYSNVLDWALKNRKEQNIKNIAITGPYGSGKSSILQTYQKNCDKELFSFLNISLATFKEELDVNSDNKVGGDELLRLIELSILQQIFYQEDEKSIPDSRFRRIISHSENQLSLASLTILFFIISVSFIIYPAKVANLARYNLSYSEESRFHLLALFTCTSCIFWWFKKMLRFMTKVRLSKFSTKDAEFSIDDDVSKSVLNSHIDEILYFFEVTKYNVVIIEDLDRFKQTEIFTKLREINLLLNSSKKIVKNIVFIYAVRDEMFIDKDRTKFFDFIIPVIPVVNSSNSKEILLKKSDAGKFMLSEDLLEDVSFFLDDMRLLHNIVNEFQVYKNNLSKNLDQNKLFAIICYKNIYPSDFVKLSSNEGDLYQAISSKRQCIKVETDKIDNNIENLKQELKALEACTLNSIEELKKVYIYKYLENLPNFSSFIIANNLVGFVDVLQDSNFDKLMAGSCQYQSIAPGYGPNNRQVNLNFKDIEREVDSKQTYLQRKLLIEKMYNVGSENLKQKIADLSKERNMVLDFKLKDLVNNSNLSVKIDDHKKGQLVTLLLKSGYIDEDYLDYISIFYEGSITKQDHQFLLNIKTLTSTKYDYQLSKTENLFSRIKSSDFSTPYILNYDLVGHLISNFGYTEQSNRVFQMLADESNSSIKFIFGFIDNGQDVKRFVSMLCKHWNNTWRYIENESVFTSVQKMRYFLLIANNCDTEDLLSICTRSTFVQTYSAVKDISKLADDLDRFNDVINTLDVKFIDIYSETQPDVVVDIIYKNNFYEINIGNAVAILKAKGQFDEDNFDFKNYESIMTSNCDSLINYINANMSKYIDNIFLQIPHDSYEDQIYLLKLMNNPNISLKQKELIMSKVNGRIDDIDNVEDVQVCGLLAKVKQIEPLWSNVAKMYGINDGVITPDLIEYLNDFDIASSLSASPFEFAEGDDSSKLMTELLLLNSLNNVSYKKITKVFNYTLSSLDFSALNEDKVEILISNNILNVSVNNFDMMKRHFNRLLPKLVNKHFLDFIDNISEFDISLSNYIHLFRSGNLLSSEKMSVLKSMDESFVIGSDDLLKVLLGLIASDTSFIIPWPIFLEIVKKPFVENDQRLGMLNMRLSEFGKEDLTDILSALPHPYSGLAGAGTRPTLDNNHFNLRLVKHLKSIDYISNFTETHKNIKVSTFRK